MRSSEATELRSFGHRFARHRPTAVAERFVRTVRTECLDWLLVLNQQHLERILEVFVDHYNRHRPHRALSLAPPEG